MSQACRNPLELYDYASGRLTEPIRREIEGHLRGCPDCRAKLTGDATFEEAVRDAAKTSLAPEVVRRLIAAAETVRSGTDGRREDQTPASSS